MKLSLQTFATVVANSAAAVQAASSQLLDLGTGSVLRALLEANAAIALWIQWLIVCVLRATRAATSTGSDLDSWMADFNFSRLPAAYAVGKATFSRYDASVAATIAPGTVVRTADGSQSFLVTADTTHALWDTLSASYIIPAGTLTADLPIAAQVPGASGNVRAGTVTLIASPIISVDGVTNALGTTGGSDAEPDSAFRNRFQNFINSRSRATPMAIEAAIQGVQQGLSYAVFENCEVSGQPRNGSFVAVVDDGSGNPSASVLQAVTEAVEAVRPIGSVFTVRGPTVVAVGISLHVSTAAGADRNSVLAAVQQNITTFVDELPIGQALPISRLAQLAYDADNSVTNVSGLTLNGDINDLTVDPFSVIRISNLAVT